MLTLHSLIPRCIDFFFMEGEPSDNDLHLFAGERSRKELPIDTDGSFVFAVIDMHMRLVMVSRVLEEQIYHDTRKT